MPHQLPQLSVKPLSSVLPSFYQWSIYSEEKGLFFNGTLYQSARGTVIIDPPEGDNNLLMAIRQLGDPLAIILTNKDHERDSEHFQAEFQVPIYAPLLDAPLLQRSPEKTYQDGDVLLDCFEVIQLSNQKSPGESALYLRSQEVMIIGDALIGKPEGQLSMLPPDKYTNIEDAKLGLQKLSPYPVKTILLGDGESILENAELTITSR